MQDLSALYRTVQSGLVRISVNLGSHQSTASGFLVEDHIITCGHVYHGIPSNSEIEFALRGDTPESYTFPASFVSCCVKALSAESAHDYCALKLPIDFGARHQFTFSKTAPEIGQRVAALGFPFGQRHLSIYNGIVSSIYQSGVANMLQLDMSVNRSNSGGPLIDDSGFVCGVICRKATGLTKMFDDLIDSFDDNIRVLNAAGSGRRVLISGVDPLKLGAATQEQMKLVAREIERSANVGIGYAIESSTLANENCFIRRPT